MLRRHRRASSGSRCGARRLGLSLYAIGSNPLAAFRSGVAVGRTKVVAYALAGPVRGARRPGADATRASARRCPGAYTLQSVAAIVLGGVSLAGGRGGVLGPIVAVFVLALVRTDLTFLGRRPEPRRRPSRARSSSGSSCSAASSRCAGCGHDRAGRGAAGDARAAVARHRAAGGGSSATGRSSRCWCCSRCSSSAARGRSPGIVERQLGRDDHPRRDPAGDPRRLPDPDDADRRHRPVGRRGRLDGGVHHGHPDGEPGPRGRDRHRAPRGASGRPRQRHRRRRLPGPPADHDPGHGPGRPRAA